MGKLKIFKNALVASVVAPLASFLPGMGSGHAAVMGSEIMGDRKGEINEFLFLLGAINTIVMGLSFVTIYAIGRTRTGAAVAVREILEGISLEDLFVVLGAVFVSGIIAFFSGIFIARIFSKSILKFDYRKISFVIIGILIVINLLMSNFLGIVVLITGSALGMFCILSGVRRIQLMGVLLVPTILFYLV